MSQPRAVRVHAIRGFSLLEAIVALTIMATSMIALYAWLSTSAIALSRVHANSQSLEDARTGLAVVETINPLQEPDGERKLQALTVRWRAEPLSDRISGITPAGLPSAFELRLYELTVEMERNGKPAGEFRVRRAGWENVRPFDPDDF